MNIVEVCKGLRECQNKIREIANKIEMDGILEIPMESVTVYGFNVKQLKQFINYGRQNNFLPTNKKEV